MTYAEFVESKIIRTEASGIEPRDYTVPLFDFQRAAVDHVLRLGRGALFLDTGLGKTACQLEWADQVPGRVLILTPLAVAEQTLREARRFGVDAEVNRSASKLKSKIVITNYERAHLFDLSQFSGVVLDESSILKSFMGKTKRWLCEAFIGHKFRLACTATPAPNDYMELGNHSDFLGHMPSNEMLARFFLNYTEQDGSAMGKYRLKGHAVAAFWQWVGSWAVCATKPSDLGDYDDSGYVLPPIKTVTHNVPVDLTRGTVEGEMFRSGSMSATEMHRDKKLTLNDRCKIAADIATCNEPVIVWCETDAESKLLTELILDAVEVTGSMDPDEKEEKLCAFSLNQARCIVTKPSIAGFGLNWQHCRRQVFASISYSYESFYQAVRRSWRFGQTREVQVDAVIAETEAPIWKVILGKQMQHDAMKIGMRHATLAPENRRVLQSYKPTHKAKLPSWIHST